MPHLKVASIPQLQPVHTMCSMVPVLPDLPFFNKSQKPRSLYEISPRLYVGNLLEFVGPN